MMLAALLGKKLKDEEILQLLEDHQVGDVVYDFDRLREGTADGYWTEARSAGFALRFDEQQALKTIFCYVSAIDGFTPIDPKVVGVTFFTTAMEAKNAAQANNVRHSADDADIAVLSLKTSWVRHEYPTIWVHYEYRGSSLAMVSMTSPK